MVTIKLYKMITVNKTNGQLPAFACVSETYQQDGLTKREYIAIKAMQALLSNDEHIKDEKSYPDITAELALQYADALLVELAK